MLARMGGREGSRRASRRGLPAQRPGRGSPGRRLRVPEARAAYAAAIADSAALLAAADALDAEVWVASNISAMRSDVPTDEVFTVLLLDLIDEAERDGRAGCAVLLTAIAAVGPREVAGAAGAAAGRVTGRAGRRHGATAAAEAPLPPWTGLLGKATVGQCWLWTDEFGECSQVFCEFAHADGHRRHGLTVTIDLAFHGVVSAIAMVSQPANLDRTIADLRRGKPGRGRVESIGAQRARSLVLAAIETSRARERPTLRSGPEPDELCYAYLPLLTCRMLGISAGEPASQAPSAQAAPATLAEAWPASRRTELVEAFLAAHPHGWSHPATDRMFVERVVDASVEVLGFPPDRIGPITATRLFGEVLPRTLIAPKVVLRSARRVAKAWVAWVAASGELSWRARLRLRRRMVLVQVMFERISSDRRVNPHFPYVADLPAHRAGGDDIQTTLDRRWFAVPEPGHRGGITFERPGPRRRGSSTTIDVDDYDAADPSHRKALTTIEQALHGTGPDVMPACVTVVEQLWADEPAQVWQAAGRLSATGVPRQQVIRRLAQVWQHCDAADPAAYAAALESVGRPVTR
ncbi:hypothetical protein GCM10010429_44850 [Micromonospora olivasterospora]|uniref:Uncharacterized protein n=2 Tax=Micromonospora olivasterospora TaxID=1880 RepID=A0A562I875_MICOL|nr:hypothetical protein JD77_02199 [Micromonospora olivasterospora]